MLPNNKYGNWRPSDGKLVSRLEEGWQTHEESMRETRGKGRERE